MPEWSFNIGDALPDANAVARFVTGLAMVNNEWHRSMDLMPKDEPDDATPEVRAVRLMLVRQQAASCYEAIAFIKAARKYPNVVTFMRGLSPDAQAHYKRLMQAGDRKSPVYLPWLRGHRNVTQHVPKVDPSSTEPGVTLRQALAGAAGETGTASYSDTIATVRFGFADNVSVRFLPDLQDNPDTIKHLSGAMLALGGFIHEAVEAYLNALPAGIVRQTG